MFVCFTLSNVRQFFPYNLKPTRSYPVMVLAVSELKNVFQEGGCCLGPLSKLVFPLARDDHFYVESHRFVVSLAHTMKQIPDIPCVGLIVPNSCGGFKQWFVCQGAQEVNGIEEI